MRRCVLHSSETWRVNTAGEMMRRRAELRIMRRVVSD